MATKLCKIEAPESLKSAFTKWVSEKRQKRLFILITGKTGVGKSRLVNALVGKRVAKEGRSKSPCTDTVTSYGTKINDIEVVVWDSPGLQDGKCDERLYLQDMESKLSQGFDVMIYCINMSERRFYDADKKAMRTLTQAFGKKIWEKSVVALTFANLMMNDPDFEDDLAYYKGEKHSWEKAIDEFLASLWVRSQVRREIPIVPTGNYKQLCLPECENWLSDLWIKCFHVMSISSGLALVKINKGRLKYPDRSAATAITAADACSPEVDENQTPMPEDKIQSANNPGSYEDIPRTIPLNQEQEDGLLKRIWNAFLVGYEVFKNLGYSIIRCFFQTA